MYRGVAKFGDFTPLHVTIVRKIIVYSKKKKVSRL